KKVISFFCLFSDGFPARSVMLANRDVDRRRLFLAALRKLGVLGGRLERFLDAITGVLLLLFAALAGLVPPPQRQDRRRGAAGAGQSVRPAASRARGSASGGGRAEAVRVGNRGPAPRVPRAPAAPSPLCSAARAPRPSAASAAWPGWSQPPW